MAQDWQGLQWSFENQMSGGDAGGLPAPWLWVKFYDGDITPDAAKVSITPTMTRASSAGYINSGASDLYVVDTVASGSAAVEAFPYLINEDGGVVVEGDRQNFIRYSQQLDDALWVQEGSVTVLGNFYESPDLADDGCTPNTDCEGALISGTLSNSGIYQITGETPASNAYVLSLWLKESSATAHTVDICIQGTGATPEQDCKSVDPSTSWQRYEHQTQFTASATGSTTVRIIVGNTSGSSTVIAAYGVQLEERCDTNAAECANHVASEYIPTTSAATARVADILSYDFGGSGPGPEFCVGGWYYVKFTLSELGAGESPICYLFADFNRDPAMYIRGFQGGTWQVLLRANFVEGTSKSVGAAAITGRQWNHIGGCWNWTDDQWSIWVDGVEQTITGSSGTFPGTDPDFPNNRFNIGIFGGTNSEQSNCHITSDFRVYDTTLSAAQWAAWYNQTKGRYGR